MSMSPAPRSGQFRHHGHRLAYELHGEDGAPPCVLVHGILFDSLLNRELARRIARLGFQVALIDLLGHGQSDRTTDPKDHRVDFYADQVLGLLDHLGWPHAVVGGVSLGCITALTVAAKAPSRVDALFLEMPVMEWSAPWAALLLAPVLVSARYGALLHRRVARVIACVPRPPLDWLASGLNMASNDPRVIAAILHGVLVGPIVPTLAQRRMMKMPALIIGHRNDKLHEHRDARSLAVQLPNAKLLMARSILDLRLRPDRLWPQIAPFFQSLLEAPQIHPVEPAAKPLPRKVAPRAATPTIRKPASGGRAGQKASVKKRGSGKVAAKKAARKVAVKPAVTKQASARKTAAPKAAKRPQGARARR
ncbi:alpha/beta fold hydrolase [Solimonas marina]|uniref:Alpha/beta hydrolase n=1 Tax=Solimonas marina TaxID=2714601 RepID=A0A969W8N1_9GAMM|nr:alpha/beta hydrolase [Solimonas marina]NKF21513.1 alpha/beta hydrolase [Solimonas marina]